jgi:hypothetical protein
MSDEKGLAEIHPTGESATAGIPPAEMATSVDTFAGKVQRKWVPEAAVSSLGLMPFFIECLKTSGGFEGWAEECPLPYTSPHAPRKRDVLGTMLLSVWAGQGRYAHIKAMRGDGVNPEWLGRRKVASEDSLRRALPGRSEEDSEQWRKRHGKASYEPLLEEPWILAADATVSRCTAIGKRPGWAAIPASQAGLGMSITATSWRIWAWYGRGRDRRVIRALPRLRNRSCGRCWTGWGSGVVRRFGGETATGERSEPCKLPSSASFPMGAS